MLESQKTQLEEQLARVSEGGKQTQLELKQAKEKQYKLQEYCS